jgi:hypothetical protein
LEFTFTDDQSRETTEQRFHKTKNCAFEDGAVKICNTEFRKGGEAGLGRYKETITFYKTQNGYLLVRDQSQFFGLYGIIPFGFNESQWILYMPATHR